VILRERLESDLHQALREHDTQRKTAIRLVLAAIANEEIASQCTLDEDGILQVIARETRQHRESLAEFEKAGRADLIAEEKSQLEVLLSYMPQQMSREEIVAAARQAIAESGVKTSKDMGQVMRLLMPRLKGKADGKTVNQVVAELLSGG
jgi:uncharacterized protein YqeY